MEQYWICVDGIISIITVSKENKDKIINSLNFSDWDWGYFTSVEYLDEKQTIDFAKSYLEEDEGHDWNCSACKDFFKLGKGICKNCDFDFSLFNKEEEEIKTN